MPIASHSFTLMLVEDDPELAFALITALLEVFENHFAIVYASNGKIALPLILLHQPDLILCDCFMPYMGGYELYTALREGPAPHYPFILMAYGGYGNCDPGSTFVSPVPPEDYLAKPFTPKQLFDKIAQYLPAEIAAYLNP